MRTPASLTHTHTHEKFKRLERKNPRLAHHHHHHHHNVRKRGGSSRRSHLPFWENYLKASLPIPSFFSSFLSPFSLSPPLGAAIGGRGGEGEKGAQSGNSKASFELLLRGRGGEGGEERNKFFDGCVRTDFKKCSHKHPRQHRDDDLAPCTTVHTYVSRVARWTMRQPILGY